jgi:hypothetical protein
MQEALVSVIKEALGSGQLVYWAYQEFPRDSGDIVRLQLVSPPAHDQSFVDERITTELPQTATVTISSATIGRRYWIELNGYLYTYDAVSTSVDAVKSALIAAIEADAEERATASDGGVGIVDLTEDIPGGIFSLSVGPAAQVAKANGAKVPVQVITGERVMTVSVGCFSHSREMITSAFAMSARIRSALDLQSSREFLANANASITNVSTSVDLSAIAGADYETRDQFSITMRMRAVITEEIGIIETVEVSLFGGDPETITPP